MFPGARMPTVGFLLTSLRLWRYNANTWRCKPDNLILEFHGLFSNNAVDAANKSPRAPLTIIKDTLKVVVTAIVECFVLLT